LTGQSPSSGGAWLGGRIMLFTEMRRLALTGLRSPRPGWSRRG